MKKVWSYSGSILILILFIISFIGECAGVDTIDTGMVDDGSGNSEPAPPGEDHPVDNSYQEANNGPTDPAFDSIYDPASDESLISTDTVESSNVVEDNSLVEDTSLELIDTTVEGSVNNIDNTDNTVSTFYQIKNQVEINSESLEYWLDVFELTDLEDELKARFLELAKKEYFIYEIKLKISELLNDGTLTEEEFKIRLLNFIRTASVNERDVPVEEIALRVEGQVSSVSTGDVTQFVTQELEGDVGVEKVQLITNRNLSEVKVSIIKLKQKPENIPLTLRENENVYQYLDIKLTDNENYVSDEDIETLNFTFKVEVAWIEERNIDKNTVVLIRYHDGEWQNLTTKLLSENETHIFFVAETEGCSTFAVVGSTLVEISEPYVTETPDVPWTFIIGAISATTLVLGLILVKARYIYVGEDGNKKANKKR